MERHQPRGAGRHRDREQLHRQVLRRCIVVVELDDHFGFVEIRVEQHFPELIVQTLPDQFGVARRPHRCRALPSAVIRPPHPGERHHRGRTRRRIQIDSNSGRRCRHDAIQVDDLIERRFTRPGLVHGHDQRAHRVRPVPGPLELRLEKRRDPVRAEVVDRLTERRVLPGIDLEHVRQAVGGLGVPDADQITVELSSERVEGDLSRRSSTTNLGGGQETLPEYVGEDPRRCVSAGHGPVLMDRRHPGTVLLCDLQPRQGPIVVVAVDDLRLVERVAVRVALGRSVVGRRVADDVVVHLHHPHQADLVVGPPGVLGQVRHLTAERHPLATSRVRHQVQRHVRRTLPLTEVAHVDQIPAEHLIGRQHVRRVRDDDLEIRNELEVVLSRRIVHVTDLPLVVTRPIHRLQRELQVILTPRAELEVDRQRKTRPVRVLLIAHDERRVDREPHR